MYINDNIASLNAWRNLTATGNRMNSVLEHLSSGLRINKAADDAAGLAISQKMLAQINGLDQATRNAQDGISMVQTAEGAMGQAQDILQRMRQLAVQASSDTETASDRYQLQIEMDQLAKQLTDIANNTEFNTKRLLTGEFASSPIAIQVGANAGQDLQFTIGAVDANTLGVGRNIEVGTINGTDITTGAPNAKVNKVVLGADNVLDPTKTYTFKLTVNSDQKTGTLVLLDGANQIGDAVSISDVTAAGTFEIGGTGVTVTLGGLGAGPAPGPYTSSVDLAAAFGDAGTSVTKTNSASGSAGNNWTASVGGGILINTKANASAALAKIDAAINQISGERAKLGATQNRLQYIINDLQITSQNLSDAKSRITDTDMAKEMAEFTKYQILQQAGVAMLAQANAMPQAVLKLLG